MKHASPLSIILCILTLAACSSGDKPPEDAKQAREMMTGKMWAVRDVGFLETSFRANKGEPFVHTFKWLPITDSTKAKFMKATLTLEVNPNSNDQTGNIAHLTGLDLPANQSYYFTSTQEESPYDRTIKLYINVVESGMQYPFTILQANSKKVLLLAPRETGLSNLVLSLER